MRPWDRCWRRRSCTDPHHPECSLSATRFFHWALPISLIAYGSIYNYFCIFNTLIVELTAAFPPLSALATKKVAMIAGMKKSAARPEMEQFTLSDLFSKVALSIINILTFNVTISKICKSSTHRLPPTFPALLLPFAHIQDGRRLRTIDRQACTEHSLWWGRSENEFASCFLIRNRYSQDAKTLILSTWRHYEG